MPGINLIDTVPSFVTQEEYSSIAASTPSSFNDLPAILKYKEEAVSVSVEPPIQGFSNEDGAKGTLYVLTSVLIFVSSTGRSFQVEYPSITLHAVSRGGPRPSIYCQLEDSEDASAPASNGALKPTTENGAAEGEDEEGAADKGGDEYSEVRELNIFPASVDALDSIFEALSHCAALHPDKFSDDGDMDDAVMDIGDSPFQVFTGDANEELSEVGKAALAHLESIIYDPFAEEDITEIKEDTTNTDEPATTGEKSTLKTQS